MNESFEPGVGLGQVLDGYRLDRLLDRGAASIIYAGTPVEGDGEVFVEIFFDGLGDRSARASLLDIGRTTSGAWYAVTEAPNPKKALAPQAPVSAPVPSPSPVMMTPPPVPARTSAPPPVPVALADDDLVDAEEGAFEVVCAPHSLAPCVSPLDSTPMNLFGVPAIDVPNIDDGDVAPPPTERQKRARKIAFASIGLCTFLAFAGLLIPRGDAKPDVQSPANANARALVSDTALPPSGASLGTVDATPAPIAPAAVSPPAHKAADVVAESAPGPDKAKKFKSPGKAVVKGVAAHGKAKSKVRP